MKIKSIIVAVVFTLMSYSVFADENKSETLTTLSSWTNQSGSTLYMIQLVPMDC